MRIHPFVLPSYPLRRDRASDGKEVRPSTGRVRRHNRSILKNCSTEKCRAMNGMRESCGLFHHQRHDTEMDLETATLEVFHITLQGFMDHRESQTLPGDLIAREKLHV